MGEDDDDEYGEEGYQRAKEEEYDFMWARNVTVLIVDCWFWHKSCVNECVAYKDDLCFHCDVLYLEPKIPGYRAPWGIRDSLRIKEMVID
jgi:hypothetical protein